jgi:hypothetical protein
MAAVIPEVAAGVTEGGAAVEGAGARAAAGPARAGGGARGARVMPVAPQRQRQGGQPRGGQQRERQFSQRARRAGRGALKARLPGEHSYQPVILAEFLVAVVVVAVSPVAKGGAPTAQAKNSPSPYSVNTLKQLIAIGGTYFVLALLASSRRAGRFAAWFGGLVLLGLGFAELANGDLQAVFRIFGPGGSDTSGGGAFAAGAPLVAPGVEQPLPSSLIDTGQQLPSSLIDTGQQLPQSLIDTSQTGSTTRTNITFPRPGVITTDSGWQLALPDAGGAVG